VFVTSGRIWSAAELEAMTPDQRAELVRDHVVVDVDQLDEGVVERARARGRELLEARGVLEPSPE
jgi:hypothetical protein